MSDIHPNATLNNQDKAIVKEYAAYLYSYRKSILLFIEHVWKLVPQTCKPEYQERWDEVMRSTGETWDRLKNEVDGHWFGDPVNPEHEGGEWIWFGFVKGEHISWQQTMILLGVEKTRGDEASANISVRSGHGIGKSATCSWIILWFLYCFIDAQVPVTAPTSSQMHDVLWKELSLWIQRMPDEVKQLYEWQSNYIRIVASPDTWFARARTSTKENTEAIAGVHSDHVLIVVDEASGVPEQVFNTAEGALTSGNVLVILISNPTQMTGYFYDSHHKNKEDWQCFAFTCEQSPLVDRQYIERQLKRHGVTGDEYKIRVKGEFPGESMMDDSGYLQLIPPSKITVMPTMPETMDKLGFMGRIILGIDPSGEGKDLCTFVARDVMKAQLVHKLVSTNAKEIAQAAITFMDRLGIAPEDVIVDAFGVGHEVAKEIAIASIGKYDVYPVLVGNTPIREEQINVMRFRRHDDEVIEKPETRNENVETPDEDLYLNIRALMYFRGRKWIYAGGMIMDANTENSAFKNELVVVKYKRSLHGNKIQLMSKKEMLKLRIPSPNIADAFALTFLRDLEEEVGTQSKEERERILEENEEVGDRHAVL